MPDYPQSDILDLTFLRAQTAGDDDLARDLLLLLKTQCLTCLPLLLRGSDPAARRDAAHTLRGAANSLGARRLGGLAARIELEATSGLEVADEETERAVAEVLRVIEVMRFGAAA